MSGYAPPPVESAPDALRAAISSRTGWLLELLVHSDEPADEIARRLLTDVDPAPPD